MYCNRDLSWLGFNYRVLQEATRADIPLYERVKFLSIFSSNLDEFFSVRFPVVLAISRLKLKTQLKIDGQSQEHLVDNIQDEIGRQLKEFEQVLERQVIPELEKNDIVLYYKQLLRPEHVAEVREVFLSRILSFMQPVFLDADVLGRLEPEANKPYMIVSLQKTDAGEMQHAIIRVPSDSPGRFFTLSPLGSKSFVMFIDDIIRANVQYIFPGFAIEGIYGIKFNRNAEIDFEDDYSGDILRKIEKQLLKRRHGAPSRFSYERGMPRNLQLFLVSIFKVDADSIFEDGCYPCMGDLAQLPDFGKPLHYEVWKALYPAVLPGIGNIFSAMEQRDMLLHFPYYSYNYVLSFFSQAAVDPAVSDIYIAFYRIASDSLIANALISAAKNGKKVTAFVELKARFDEANNIAWSKKMKAAGVSIIYSIPGIKVHSKIAMVTKDGGNSKSSYALVSTGNFNELTAHFYTDFALLTTDKDVNSELLQLFHFLEKRELPGHVLIPFGRLLVSKFNMLEQFEELIYKEIQKAAGTGNGLIRVKVNSLEEPAIIELLYQAGRQGVTVQLIVRSICCLVTGVDGGSANIRARRVIGRYLEHSRLFIFGEREDAMVIMGSSDWMTRNLYHRIETCVTITDAACRAELLDYFAVQWQDAEEIYPEDTLPAAEETHKDAQLSIYNYLKEKR